MRFFFPVFLFLVVSIVFLLLFCGLPFAAFAMDLHVLFCLQATADMEEFYVYFLLWWIFSLISFLVSFLYLLRLPFAAIAMSLHVLCCLQRMSRIFLDCFGSKMNDFFFLGFHHISSPLLRAALRGVFRGPPCAVLLTASAWELNVHFFQRWNRLCSFLISIIFLCHYYGLTFAALLVGLDVLSCLWRMSVNFTCSFANIGVFFNIFFGSIICLLLFRPSWRSPWTSMCYDVCERNKIVF